VGAPDRENCVNPASNSPNGGEVVETTIRKRIVPLEKKETPEFWSYFETLKPDDWSPYKHKLLFILPIPR